MKLSQEIIDVLVPKHSRTSCREESQGSVNGFRNEMGYPECARCYLLIHKNEDLDDLRKTVEIDTSIRPKYVTKMVEVKEIIQD